LEKGGELGRSFCGGTTKKQTGFAIEGVEKKEKDQEREGGETVFFGHVSAQEANFLVSRSSLRRDETWFGRGDMHDFTKRDKRDRRGRAPQDREELR